MSEDGASDRRTFLTGAAATAASTALAGCNIFENVGDKDTDETTKTADQYGLDADNAEDMGCPTRGSGHFTDTVSFTYEGSDTVYVFHIDEQVFNYGHTGNVDFPATIVSTRKAEAEGAERNRRIAEPLKTEVESGRFETPWLDVTGLVSMQSPGYVSQPREVRTDRSGPRMGSGSRETYRVFESVVGPYGGGSRSEQAKIQVGLARTVFQDHALVAGVGTSVDVGESVPEDRLDYVAKFIMERLNPNPATSWSDPPSRSFKSKRLVQTVSKTRVQESPPFGTTYHESDDPDVVSGENAAPVFTLDYSPDVNRIYNEIQVNYANRNNLTDRFWMPYGLVTNDTRTQARFFDKVSRDTVGTEPVTFEATSGTNSVSIRVEAPVGPEVASTTLSKGSDYSVTDRRPLRVGFVTVRDPAGGSNYGDSGGVANSYQETVEGAIEYLHRVFPGRLFAYRHRTPFRGRRHNFGTGIYDDHIDAQNLLENISNRSSFPTGGDLYAPNGSTNSAERAISKWGFDVWVIIVPDGYYSHYGKNVSGIAMKWQTAGVSAMEVSSRPAQYASVATAAQEIGHHFVDQPYDSPSGSNGDRPMAQRAGSKGKDKWVGNNAGGISTKVDLDHARHLDSTVGNNGPDDDPGVASEAFDLTDGTFNLVEDFRIGPGHFNADRNSASVGVVDLRESFMSYTNNRAWTDAEIHQELIDSSWNAVTLNDHIFSAFGRVDEDGMLVFESTRAYEGKPLTEDVEDGNVLVEMVAPDGEVLETRRVSDDLEAHHDADVPQMVSVQLPFPQTAAEFRATREDRLTRVNPIVRPIRDAVGRVPDRGFQGDPSETRARIHELLDSMVALMSDRVYEGANDQLSELDELLADAIKAEYERYENQPNRAALLALNERMHERLATLAEY